MELIKMIQLKMNKKMKISINLRKFYKNLGCNTKIKDQKLK